MATTCLVSLWMALYTTPKEPVPSFSSRVYWLAGFELGMGAGSGARLRCRSSRGEDDGERVRTFGCETETASEYAGRGTASIGGGQEVRRNQRGVADARRGGGQPYARTPRAGRTACMWECSKARGARQGPEKGIGGEGLTMIGHGRPGS
jgi:hypothetical protein